VVTLGCIPIVDGVAAFARLQVQAGAAFIAELRARRIGVLAEKAAKRRHRNHP
jgi:hypothetical protein